jgi:hypothetical protein
VRIQTFLMLLLCSGITLGSAHGAPLERGVAVIDPLTLKELDLREHRTDTGAGPDTSLHADIGFGLNRMLDSAASDNAPLLNDRLFALPSMAPIRKALDEEFERYIAERKKDSPRETVGVGPSFDFQLFDRALLYSGQTRFVLSGIVNRMDRAYVAPESCGEVRLLYRLTRIGGVESPPSVPPSQEAAGNSIAKSVTLSEALTNTPRLPMTLNIVLKAKGDTASVSCAEIARRWLAMAELPQGGSDLALKLMSEGGPLELIKPENIDRIETNLQIAHTPKSELHDFRTDYLMKVFHYNPQAKLYEEATLENQYDRERILNDQALGQEFKSWLLDPKHLSELDRGIVLIPEKFLKTVTVAPTPIGFVRSSMQPAFGLVEGDQGGEPLFKQTDIVTALKQAADSGVAFQNIRSPAGFEQRLNDITCGGCHQIRGIGGFHFPGVDWMAEKPSNSMVVPASPHFFADQIRRRDVVTALRDGQPVDYSRGFSDRPQQRGSTELAGTEYDDGWGAHCYQEHADAADNDPSFTPWSCAAGLACEVMASAGKSTRMGMCFIKSR